jgi:drug/metabolite transporter (DMT)-like permease
MIGSKKAHLATFTANLIYGANFSIAKIVMPAMIKPNGFILLRVFFATILFWLMKLITAKDQQIERKDLFRFFLLGLFGVAINQLLFFQGLSKTSNINAALIMTSNPVMVMFFAGLIIGERITLQRILGIACGIIGAGSLIFMGSKHGVGSFTGDSMIFLNAASYAIFLVMVKPMMKKYNTWLVLGWTFFFGTLIVIPFGLNNVSEIQWNTFESIHWIAVVFVIFCTTFLAYLLNTLGLKELSPAVVSYYIYLQPIFATAISMAMNHESLRWIQIAACLLIFTGVWLVTQPPFVKAKS